MTAFLFNLLLAIAWVAVSGSASLHNLVLGFVLERGRTRRRPRGLWRQGLSPPHAPASCHWRCLFLKELTLSAWVVAMTVLRPRMDIRPGIFAFPLTVDARFRDHAACQSHHADAGHALGRRFGGSQDALCPRARLLRSGGGDAHYRERLRTQDHGGLPMMPPLAIVSGAATITLVDPRHRLLLTVYRVIAGPTLPDRILALDMLTGIAIGFIAALAVKTAFRALHRYRDRARAGRLPRHGRLRPLRPVARCAKGRAAAGQRTARAKKRGETKVGKETGREPGKKGRMMEYVLAIATAVLMLAGAFFALSASHRCRPPAGPLFAHACGLQGRHGRLRSSASGRRLLVRRGRSLGARGRRRRLSAPDGTGCCAPAGKGCARHRA